MRWRKHAQSEPNQGHSSPLRLEIKYGSWSTYPPTDTAKRDVSLLANGHHVAFVVETWPVHLETLPDDLYRDLLRKWLRNAPGVSDAT